MPRRIGNAIWISPAEAEEDDFSRQLI